MVMRAGVSLRILAALVVLASQAATQQVCYVTNYETDVVRVIDIATRQLSPNPIQLDVNAEPRGIAFRPGAQEAWVVESSLTAQVSRVDMFTRSKFATGIPVALPSHGIAFHPDGDRAYVTQSSLFAPGSVTVIDTETEATHSILMDAWAVEVAFLPDGSKAYVTHNSNLVTVIDTATETTQTISLSAVAPGVAFSGYGVACHPDGSEVYVTAAGNAPPGTNHIIAVISATTDTIVASIPVAEAPRDVAFLPDGTKAYVATSAGDVVVVDTDTRATTNVYVGSGPRGIAVTRDGSEVWVSRSPGGVAIIQTSDNEVIDIPIPGLPYDLAIGPRGSGIQDDDPPIVAINAPVQDEVFGTLTTPLDATITDVSSTSVISSPSGLTGSTPPGGGDVAGTVALENEGENTLTVSATDAFGNRGGSSVTVIRDTTPPVIDVLSPSDSAVLGETPATFTAQVSDLTATTVTFGQNDESLPAGGGVVSGNVDLVTGTNTVTFTARDAAGNMGTAARNVILDLAAPIVSIDSPVDGACFGPGESPIAAVATVSDLTATTVSSVPAGIAGSLPAGGGSVTGPLSLVEGWNTIVVSATDATSRTGSDSVAVLLDTTPPAVSLNSPAGGDPVRGLIDFDAIAVDASPGSGVSLVELSVDGSVVASFGQEPFETSLDTTGLTDGLHVLAVTATDGKGNSASASRQVIVDNTSPVLSIDTPLSGWVVSGTIAFDATVTDAGSGVTTLQMQAAGQEPNPTDGSRAFVPPIALGTGASQVDTTRFADGPLVLSAAARDAAGNDATAAVTVQVDNQAPSKTLIAPADGDVVSGTINIAADAQDPNLATLEIFVDGVTVGSSTTSSLVVPFDTTARLDGPMTVTVRATDSAGNSSTCSATVTVDNVPSVDCKLHPETLNMKSKGKNRSVTLRVEGSNLGMLMPTEEHDWELRVPGGDAASAG